VIVSQVPSDHRHTDGLRPHRRGDRVGQNMVSAITLTERLSASRTAARSVASWEAAMTSR
jgi:hypothetical protein